MPALTLTDTEVRDYAVAHGFAETSEDVDTATFRRAKRALAQARIDERTAPAEPAGDTPPENVITVAVEVSIGGRVVGAHVAHVPLPEGTTTA